MAVKGFDVFYLLADSLCLDDALFDLQVAKQRLFTKFFASLLEDGHACVLLPGLEVFLPGVKPEIVYSIEVIEDPLLLQKLLKLHELDFAIMILGQSPLGNDHIFAWIFLLELDDLPVIRIVSSIHIAKFLRHLAIYPS